MSLGWRRSTPSLHLHSLHPHKAPRGNRCLSVVTLQTSPHFWPPSSKISALSYPPFIAPVTKSHLKWGVHHKQTLHVLRSAGRAFPADTSALKIPVQEHHHRDQHTDQQGCVCLLQRLSLSLTSLFCSEVFLCFHTACSPVSTINFLCSNVLWCHGCL